MMQLHNGTEHFRNVIKHGIADVTFTQYKLDWKMMFPKCSAPLCSCIHKTFFLQFSSEAKAVWRAGVMAAMIARMDLTYFPFNFLPGWELHSS
jgi:hypothetical protein